MNRKTTIGIIGCGNMGKALAQRLSEKNQVFLYDHHYEKAQTLEGNGVGQACHDLKELIALSGILIIAVKPQSFKELANSIVKNGPIEAIIISLLSGTMLAQLREVFPDQRLVRMMPNLAVIYGSGAIALSSDKALADTDSQLINTICQSLGKVYWLNESKINAFTALAGSGPAFVLAMVESMVDAGIAMGFSAKEAQEIAHQMVYGSIDLWKQSGKHPGELKWQVTSPGGTTIAGIRALEEASLRSGIIETFMAAYGRANEMEQQGR